MWNRCRGWSWLIVGVIALTACPAVADLIIVRIPNSPLMLVMQGKATLSRTTPVLTFVNSETKQTFDLPRDGVEIITMPSLNQIGTKKTIQAKGDAEGLATAAIWALDHGLLTEYHRAVDALAALNADHPLVTGTKRIKSALETPISDDAAEEADLPKRVGGAFGSDSLSVLKSAHFLLVHNTPANAIPKRKHLERRLADLELAYESFVYKCAERGLPVQIPTRRMKVAIMAGKVDLPAGGSAVPALDTKNFYEPRQDFLMLEDLAEDPRLELLRQMAEEIQKQTESKKSSKKGKAAYGNPGQATTTPMPMAVPGGAGPGTGTGGAGPNPAGWGGLQWSQLPSTYLTKFAASMSSLLTSGVENMESEALNRESTRMFAAHCGLWPRGTNPPRWLQDGLAGYFETPAESGRLRLGDVGRRHLHWYQAGLRDADRVTLSDIIQGYLYTEQMTKNDIQRAEANSWAVVHFLIEKHPEGFAKLVQALQSLPPDVETPPEVITALFREAIGRPADSLNTAWRDHIRDLKPEYEVLKETEAESTVSGTPTNSGSGGP